jgi:FtsP/CotA-like multicopper oxidase with cupredoxin domain
VAANKSLGMVNWDTDTCPVTRHIGYMPRIIRRRQLLTTSASMLLLPAMPRAQQAAPVRELFVDKRTISVGNRPASVYRVGGADGGAGLVLAPGERFRVKVRNRLDEPTIVHWHGQTPPAGQDGVAEMSGSAHHGAAPATTGPSAPGAEALIGPRGERDYDFLPRPGTHWMHSHHGLQEQRLLAAPLIVRDAETARQDVQDVVMMLHDFSWRDPADILAGLGGGGHAGHGMTMAMPMRGAVELNDVLYDAFLANDRTLADPQIVRVERGVQVRLRVINGASATQFWLDLGALEDTILATDGNPVAPMNAPATIPLAIGQRLDIGFRMPSAGAFPILAQVEGTTKRTGIILATPDATLMPFLDGPAPQAMPPVDLSLDRRVRAREPLPARAEDVQHTIVLGGDMARFQWTINGRMWADREPIPVRLGQRVVLDLVNRTPMSHPMHLHGHHFQVVGVNDAKFPGPMRDTVLVPPNGGRVSIAFDADNPGKWLFHCHNLYHMAAGMMTELAYTGTT